MGKKYQETDANFFFGCFIEANIVQKVNVPLDFFFEMLEQ